MLLSNSIFKIHEQFFHFSDNFEIQTFKYNNFNEQVKQYIHTYICMFCTSVISNKSKFLSER
jgi:hypothetical protein